MATKHIQLGTRHILSGQEWDLDSTAIATTSRHHRERAIPARLGRVGKQRDEIRTWFEEMRYLRDNTISSPPEFTIQEQKKSPPPPGSSFFLFNTTHKFFLNLYQVVDKEFVAFCFLARRHDYCNVRILHKSLDTAADGQCVTVDADAASTHGRNPRKPPLLNQPNSSTVFGSLNRWYLPGTLYCWATDNGSE